MATAGERYDERTGNIWSYAHRGDMTGLKAAVVRGVDVNIVNTVGWTACHAAAAGGQCKALRYLVKKMDADLTITDKGGNLAVHHAAKNGHVQALRTLQELGDDVTRVRLSHAKGKAARDFVADCYRKAGKKNTEGGDGENGEVVEAVGYARKQSKSTAFWGPRRTPISCAIKKKIMKDKRKIRKEKQKSKRESEKETESLPEMETTIVDEETKEPSYIETVQQIKRGRKQRRRQRQIMRNQPKQQDESDEEITIDPNTSDQNKTGNANIAKEMLVHEAFNSDDDDDVDDHEQNLFSSNCGFAVLALTEDDSDNE